VALVKVYCVIAPLAMAERFLPGISWAIGQPS
jgi:hypothetical protein